MRRLALAVAAAALAGCGSDDGPTQPAQAKADPGLAVFTAQGCGSCHRLTAAGSSATLGPNLDNALDNRSRASIVQAIVEPPRDSIMPQDFGERMSRTELDRLVDFLVKAAGSVR